MRFNSHTITLVLFWLLFGMIANGVGGCALFPKTPTAQEERVQKQYVMHQVKYPGETLALISLWYTGDVKNWERIAKVNPGLDVKKIKIGDYVRIPRELAVKELPMPKTAIKKSEGVRAAPKSGFKEEIVKTPPPEENTAAEKKAADLERRPSVGEEAQQPEEASIPPKSEGVAQSSKQEALPEESSSGRNTAQQPLTRRVITGAPEQEAVKPTTSPEQKRQLTRDELLRELLEE